MKVGFPRTKMIEVHILEGTLDAWDNAEVRYRIPISDASAQEVHEKIMGALQEREELTAVAVKILKTKRKTKKGTCSKCGTAAAKGSPYQCRACKNAYQNAWNHKKARMLRKLTHLPPQARTW